ncbi:MAG: ATP synthase subunit C [Xanthomonadales bacterium]|nr:ATP synthase subunit C [Xanthomonadales bacterium]
MGKVHVHKTIILLLAASGLLAVIGSLALWIPDSLAAAGGEAARTDPRVTVWGFAAAAAATAFSAFAAGYAVAAVGSSGIGALVEKPELFGRILVLVGLAEGIAIYGLIVSILILNTLTP